MKNTCMMAAEKTPPDLVAETDDLWAVEYVRRHRFGAHSRNPHPHVKSCKSDSSRIHAVPRVVAPRSAVQQHVEDVSVELSRSADRVILVGHSYAGMIISGVVEMNPTQVRRLVFLDAFIPEDEQSVLDLLPPEIQRCGRISSEAVLRSIFSQSSCFGLGGRRTEDWSRLPCRTSRRGREHFSQ